MTLSTHSHFKSVRQKELQEKIFLAKHLKEEKNLSFLESLWVHRYGLSNLPSYESLVSPKYLETITEQLEVNGRQLLSEVEIQKTKSFELGKSGPLFSQEEEESSELLEIESDDPQEIEGGHYDSLPRGESDGSVDKLIPKNSGERLLVSPPPPPNLNRLRRWIPGIESELPKAS